MNAAIAALTGVLVMLMLARSSAVLFGSARVSTALSVDAAAAASPTGQTAALIADVIRRLSQRRARRRGLSSDAVAAWCDGIARRVRGGATLRESVCREIPEDPVLTELTDGLRRGIERGQPLADIIERQQRLPPTTRPVNGAASLTLACSTIEAAASLGGGSAAPLERAAAALRQRSADRQERAAQSAQARLSAHVLTAVPVLMLAVLIVTDVRVRIVLATPAGVAAVVIGASLNVGGWCWMRRIIGGP